MYGSVRLCFEIDALYINKYSPYYPERGSNMLSGYLLLGCVMMFTGAINSQIGGSNNSENLFVVISAWLSFGMNLFYFLFAAIYCYILVQCNTCNLNHNKSIRVGCQRLCR